MVEQITRVEFARRVGKSERWIRKLIAAGRLPVLSTGKLDWVAAKEAYDATTGASPNTPPVVVTVTAEPDKPTDSEKRPVRAANMTVAQVNAALNRAKLRETQLKAKLRELEYNKEIGLLVPVKVVQQDAERIATKLRSDLLSMGHRLALQLEGKRATEIEVILSDAMNDAIETFRTSTYFTEATPEG